MPLHLERIDWMPSPPLAPDDGPIDFAHLKRMTLGDAGLEREVLAMFAAQAARLIGALAALPADAARAGAYAERFGARDRRVRVADAAEPLEAAIGGDDAPKRSPNSAMRWPGADGHRRDPAPVLIATAIIRRHAGAQVFAPSAGAGRIDPL